MKNLITMKQYKFTSETENLLDELANSLTGGRADCIASCRGTYDSKIANCLTDRCRTQARENFRKCIDGCGFDTLSNDESKRIETLLDKIDKSIKED